MTKLDITLRPYLGVDDLKRVLRPLGCLGIFILLGHYLLDIVYEITGHDVLLIVHREKTASDIDFLIIVGVNLIHLGTNREHAIDGLTATGYRDDELIGRYKRTTGDET